jgi:exopolysaccharide biosynthesis polyprenyl glycosylphosphotransferase
MIPGMLPGDPRHKRKKISPAILKQHISAWVQFQEPAQRQPVTFWQTFSQIVLPAPALARERLGLATQVLADFLCITISITLSNSLAAVLGPGLLPRSMSFSSLAGSALLYGSLFTLFGYSERLYHRETARERRRQVVVIVKGIVWASVLAGVGCASAGIALFPLFMLAVSLPLTFALMFACRWVRQSIPARGLSGNDCRNVLIIGAGQLGRKLAYVLQQGECGHLIFRGFLDPYQPVAGDVLGSIAELPTIARREFIDEIILAVPPDSNLAREVIWQARRNHIDVKMALDLPGTDPARITLEKYGDLPLLTLREEHIPRFGLLVKRTVDVALSACAIMLVAPLLAGIAFAIKLDSPGPVLYCAPRLGLKGRRFLCYKFRTMVKNADGLKDKLREHNERQGAFFKMTDDPRITRVGRFLRRYSLDELPQLWNVLRGEMSLVGPRPHPLDDVQRYQLEDFQRLNVVPGLTGLWQVTARRDPSFERALSLDREYIGRWSLGMDLWILRKTLGVVWRGEGT